MKFENNIIEFMQKDSKFERVEDKKLLVIEFRKQIFNKFLKMKDIEDFVELLNDVNKTVYKNSKILEVKRITYHAFYNKKRYTSFEISKKSGGIRTINAPIESLKNIQMTVAFILSCIYKFPMVVHGFTNDKSVVTNAKHHVNKNYVYNIDLEDFFGSIHKARIEKRLQVAPYNLSNTKAEIATLVARLVTIKSSKEEIVDGKTITKKYAKLPQGSPTSPILSNIICERLDRRLLGLAKKFNVKYTRYADDITFSSMHNVYQKDSEFLIELERIITDQNFKINPKKTRLQKRGYRQEVTGLIVNEKVNVDRRYIKQLRAMLYSIEKSIRENGTIEKAEEKFERHYLKDKGHLINQVPSMENVLLGKLQYLKMVKGVEGTYLKLITRYNKIPEFEFLKEKNIRHNPNEVAQILNKFSSNDKLRFSNHPWSESIGYDDFIKDLADGWNEIEKSFRILSPSLCKKIENFLFSKNENIIGWSSPIIKKALQNNKIPNSIKFDSPIQGFQTFSDAIEDFKSLFVIKQNDKKTKLLKRFIKIRKELKEEIDLEIKLNLDSLKEDKIDKFFTDSKRLEQALKLILTEINDHSSEDAKDVIIEVDTIKVKEQDFIELKIIHIDSKASATSDKLKETISKNGGNFKSIYDKLISVCDWSIDTICSDKFRYKIDYLYPQMDNNQPHCTKIEEIIKGFTHILRFYI